MGGIAALGGGIGGLLQVMNIGNATNTALQTAMLAQQFQQQQQDMVLQMGLSKMQNQQMQVSMIGHNIQSIFESQQKLQGDNFKVTKKTSDEWIKTLGGTMN